MLDHGHTQIEIRRYGDTAHLIKVKVLISSRAPQINKWAYLVARRSELVLVGSVCSSLFTMDGGRFKVVRREVNSGWS